jgi:hypothetical protein
VCIENVLCLVCFCMLVCHCCALVFVYFYIITSVHVGVLYIFVRIIVFVHLVNYTSVFLCGGMSLHVWITMSLSLFMCVYLVALYQGVCSDLYAVCVTAWPCVRLNSEPQQMTMLNP